MMALDGFWVAVGVGVERSDAKRSEGNGGRRRLGTVVWVEHRKKAWLSPKTEKT